MRLADHLVFGAPELFGDGGRAHFAILTAHNFRLSIRPRPAILGRRVEPPLAEVISHCGTGSAYAHSDVADRHAAFVQGANSGLLFASEIAVASDDACLP